MADSLLPSNTSASALPPSADDDDGRVGPRGGSRRCLGLRRFRTDDFHVWQGVPQPGQSGHNLWGTDVGEP